MKKQNPLRNQEGFTLVEIIAVLIILGILAAVAVPRYIDLENNAKTRAVDAAVAELNGRESLTWADVKISVTGYDTVGDAGDIAIFDRISDGLLANRQIDLGPDYAWQGDPVRTTGGGFLFKGEPYTFSRTPSTNTKPAIWSKQ